MDQLEPQESDQLEQQQVQPQVQNEDTANNFPEQTGTTQTEQPADAQESNLNQVDEGLEKLKARLGISDPDTPKKPEVKTKEDQSSQQEQPETKPVSQEQTDAEIELEDGRKLIAVTVDGITVHTTPDKATDVKNGLLRQSDYTKKTQALTAERNAFVSQVQEFQKLQEEIALSGSFEEPEPLESEYVDQFATDEERYDQIQNFRQKKSEWLASREQWLAKKTNYNSQREISRNENTKNTESFINEYGNTAFEEIYPELMEIKAALNTTGTTPFPKNMLKYYYLGKNFDRIMKQKVQEAKATTLDKVDKNTRKSNTIRQTGTGGITKDRDRYDAAAERIQQRGSGW